MKIGILFLEDEYKLDSCFDEYNDIDVVQKQFCVLN